MSMSKLELMEASFLPMAEYCLCEARIECESELPAVAVYNEINGVLNWTLDGRMTEEGLYRLEFIFEDTTYHLEWEPGIGIETYSFPVPTEERFFSMAAMMLAFQSDVLLQIQ